MLVLALWACGGPDPAVDVVDDPPPAGVESCIAAAPPVVPLRRLSQREMAASGRDLTGVDIDVWSRVPLDALVLGFDNSAYRGNVSLLEADAYMRSSEDLAAQVDLASILPCTPTGADDEVCARSFVETFGRRAWRRPLDPVEADALVALWHVGADAESFESGAELVLQAMFQSPEYLYRVRAGDGYDRAADLAYFVWGSTPDDALLDAADAGELATEDGVRATVDRMILDPRARDQVGRFVELWMGTSGLPDITREDPGWTPELADALLEETRRFTATVAFDDGGTLGDLLTRAGTVADGAVAGLYGVDGPVDWAWIELDPAQRSGLLTQGSVLALYAHENQTSPVHRGKLVREQLLCHTLPPPPGELDISLPPVDPDMSTRERFARHSQDPMCSGCHVLMDPIGFGFERYDSIGRWRELEGNGVPVESTGYVTASSLDAPFDGVPELAAILAADPMVGACLETQLFRYARGREETSDEACFLDVAGPAALTTPVVDLFREAAVTAALEVAP